MCRPRSYNSDLEIDIKLIFMIVDADIIYLYNQSRTEQWVTTQDTSATIISHDTYPASYSGNFAASLQLHNINVAQRIFIMFYNFDLPSSSSFVATNKCDNSLKILGVIRSDYAAGLAGAVTYCDIQKPQLLSPISFWTTYPGVFFDFKSENVVSTGFYLKYFVGKY